MITYAIAGTGRSGTAWASRLWSLAGGACGHEQVFDHNRVGTLRRLEKPSRFRGDASLALVGYLDHHVLIRLRVLHLWRDPQLVLSSFLSDDFFVDDNAGSPYRQFMATTLQGTRFDLDGADHTGRAIRWIAGSTHLIATLSRGPYRLETLDELAADPHRIVDVMNFTGVAASEEHIEQVAVELGSLNRHNFTGDVVTVAEILNHPDGHLLEETIALVAGA